MRGGRPIRIRPRWGNLPKIITQDASTMSAQAFLWTQWATCVSKLRMWRGHSALFVSWAAASWCLPRRFRTGMDASPTRCFNLLWETCVTHWLTGHNTRGVSCLGLMFWKSAAAWMRMTRPVQSHILTTLLMPAPGKRPNRSWGGMSSCLGFRDFSLIGEKLF